MSTNNKKGFTIIEVVLVLAIAGLIFLMVFIALPALQRSQRNTQRRSDMGRVVSAVTQYKANNKNNLPDDGDAFADTYVGAAGSDQRQDPDGTDYDVTVVDKPTTNSWTIPAATDANAHTIYLVKGTKCGATEGTADGQGVGDKQFAVFYRLEGGSVTCTDDQ